MKSSFFIDYKRLYILYGSILFMFFILIFRLIYLHIISADFLVKEGNKRSLRIQNIPVFRASITDRNGQLLALSIPVYSVWMDPKQVSESGSIHANILRWNILSNILNISWNKLLFSINTHNTERFLYLSRHLDPIVAEKIDQLKLPGIYIQQELSRYYPAGPAAAHLVGITDIDNKGLEGAEKSFDNWLSGSPKKRIIRQDRLGKVVEYVSLLDKGQCSKSISLSIDERLQCLAYHELNNSVIMNKAESGSIVLIDINTGEILAMANSPSYDPNNFAFIPPANMRNRAITDIFEPGSTIKPIVIMAALENRIIDRDTIIDTLPYMIHGHKIKDVSYHKKLSISEILRKSSNVGISKLALSMPVSVLLNSYLDFGLGKSTNIGLIGENKGKIYSYDHYCSEIEHAALSYGYGIMITPLQLAKIYATIGNMGLSRPISILKVNNKSIINRESERRVFSQSLVRTVLDMLEVTTKSSSGCYRAAIPGYRVAVKTGTIKKVGLDGKYVNKYIACTAGIAPATNPKFALVVVINDPKNGLYYGGSVSAPVFKSVMSNTLKIMNINPDFLQ